MSENDFYYRCQNCHSINTELFSFTENGVKYFYLHCHDCDTEKIIEKEYLEDYEYD